jgi:transcription elongation factor GreA
MDACEKMITKTTDNLTYITPKGLKRLETELAYLRTERRKEIAQYLQDTLGDCEDNEYLIALDEKAFVEGRIRQLEKLLCNIRVIQPDQTHCGVVDLGSTVVLRDNNMETETYTIVGSAEADPQNGMISNVSPLGKALLGSKVGEEVEYKTPGGLLNFRVLAVQ